MNPAREPFRRGETAELAVETLAFGGKGVARRDGFVVFVEGAVPGDRVRAVVTRTRRSYAEARALEILNPSGERVQPRCRHFGECGGCSWQTLRYDVQLRYKSRQVGECLRHIGGLEGFAVDEPVEARPLWRYRNKVEFSFGGGGEDLVLGFHKPGRWQELAGIKDCLLHSELTNDIRNHIRDFARASGEPAYDQRGGSGFWRHLVLREGLGTGEVMVNIVTAPGSFPGGDELVREIGSRFPQVSSLLWSINDTRASVASGFPYTVMAGRDHIHESIGGLRLKLSPSSFLQTNTAMSGLLYRKALGFAGLSGGETVLDLYSGIGSIALLAAGSCRQVLGVEVMDEAVALARENAAANHIGNALFRSGKVRVALKELGLEGRPDLVILDPPRAGAGKKEIDRILALEAPRIVYVSCNPSTLAGNARQLTEGGYRLARTVAVDMFPHTPHIETVALLERNA